MKNSNVTNYGAVSAEREDVEADRSFDADAAYYLKGGSEENLSPQQKLKKLVLIALPILIAALVIGGFAFLITRDFGSLYPGPGRDPNRISRGGPPTTVHSVKDDDGPLVEPSLPAPTHNKNSDQPAPSSTKDEGASCSAHPNCSGLTGDCCPTIAGVMLSCCT